MVAEGESTPQQDLIVQQVPSGVSVRKARNRLADREQGSGDPAERPDGRAVAALGHLRARVNAAARASRRRSTGGG